MSYSIVFDLYINAPKAKVFDAFALPQHLDNWWTLKSSGEPKLDAIYNLNFTDDYDWYATVSKVEKHSEFYLKMTTSDADWMPTTFGISLEDKDEKTLLKFSHTNWLIDNHHFRFSAFCWAQLLNALKNYVESGTVVPFNERS